jgi:hypothetical protein
LQQIPEDQKPLLVAHEVSPYQKCSYTQAVVNGNYKLTTHTSFLMLVSS